MPINVVAFFEIIHDMLAIVEHSAVEIERLRSAVTTNEEMAQKYLSGTATGGAESRLEPIRVLRQRVDAIYRDLQKHQS